MHNPTIEGVEALLLSKFLDIGAPITDREHIRSAAVDVFHYCNGPAKQVDAQTARRDAAHEIGGAFADKFNPSKTR